MHTTKTDPKPEKCPAAESVQFLTLSEAAARLGEGGRRPSVCTIWRWARKGCRGVRLEYARFGREIRVTPDALAAFGRHLAAADKALDAPVASTFPPRKNTPAQREKQITAAEARLAARGLNVGGGKS